MKSTKWFSITKAFQDSVLMDALVTLENSLELSVLFKRIGWRIISACFAKRGKLPSRIRFLRSFLQHLFRLKKYHGATFVVKYLKACQLAVQKNIAGTPITSLREVGGDLPFPRLDGRGLPRIIPVYDRRLIKSNSSSVIRYWLTLFSLYRIIKIPGQLKLSTITDGLSVSELEVKRVGSMLKAIANDFKHHVPFPRGSDSDICLLEAASSTSRTSWTGLFKDVVFLERNGLSSEISKMINLLGLSRISLSWDLFNLMASIRKDLNYASLHKVARLNMGMGSEEIGQLSVKEEAAGKLRVFAMVDVWTQSVLKPLHDSLFTFLKWIPNDATFDQRGAVKRCIEKVKISKKSFGYDLSAATDRLPISVQKDIISAFFGIEVSNCWEKLLIDRDYTLSYGSEGKPKEFYCLRYSVGQPMGALSSWAMLAVTHHLIVQLAARMSGKCSIKNGKFAWYDNYELLGDDIVLFDELVASFYLSLMRSLGVEINLSKSVIAHNETFEFAKVTGNNGKDVSALSWKAFVSQNSWMGRSNIIFSLLERPLGIPGWASWAHAISRHGRIKGIDNMTILSIWTMFSNSGRVPLTVVLSSLMSVKSAVRRSYRDILLKANIAYAILVISAILQGKPIPLKNLDNPLWRSEESWIKIMLSKKLLVWGHQYDNVRAASKLAEEMTRYLVPGLPEDKALFSFNMDPKWGIYEETINALFLNLYTVVNSKLATIERGKVSTQLINESIDNISLRIDSMDRVNELLQLVERAKAKDAPNAKVGLVKTGTPLKVIKMYLKGSKVRPNWTYGVWR